MLQRGQTIWRVGWRDESKPYGDPARYPTHDFATKDEAEAFAKTAPVEPKPEPIKIEKGYLRW